jgi:hypothetical protein
VSQDESRRKLNPYSSQSARHLAGEVEGIDGIALENGQVDPVLMALALSRTPPPYG